jgi:predicted CoA-binding protein
MKKRTLVLGASEHSYRYSNIAVHRLLAAGHEVFALGSHAGKIGNVAIADQPGEWSPIHTVTIYLNPYNQQGYYRYLLELKPERVIFNPGAENYELESLLIEQGITCLNACTLVMLSTGQF